MVSRRGAVEAPVRSDPSLRPGLAFMTLHFQDEVATNLLTIDAVDPKSGTAEFKATAIRIERVPIDAPHQAGLGGRADAADAAGGHDAAGGAAGHTPAAAREP